MKENAPEKDFGSARSWKEAGKGGFILTDVRHFPFLPLNTRFPLAAPSPIPAADICFSVPSRRAASPTLPLYSCWKSNDPARWKQGAGTLPAKVCLGPSLHPGLEAAPCRLGHAPAAPFRPLTSGARCLRKQGAFSRNEKWQMKKRKPDLQFSLCFSRHPKKRSPNSLSGSPGPARTAVNSPRCCTGQHLAVQHLVRLSRVQIFFYGESSFQNKSVGLLELAGHVGYASGTAADVLLIRGQALGRWFFRSR